MSESTWAPTPSAETFGTLKTLISGYVLAAPDDPEVLQTAEAGIRRAIDRINTRVWNYLVTSTTITFAAGDRSYSIENDFKQPLTFRLKDASGNETDSRLGYAPWAQVVRDEAAMPGTPCLYSVLAPFVYLDKIPPASWVATYPTALLWYYRKAQYPGSAGAAIDVTSEMVSFVQAWAEGFTADRHAVAKAASAYARATDAWRLLVSDDCHGQQTDWE